MTRSSTNYFRGHASFDNYFFTNSQHPCFFGMKKRKQCDEKHGKTVTTITSTPKDRPLKFSKCMHNSLSVYYIT